MYLGAELDMVRSLACPSAEWIQTLELFVRNLLEEGSVPKANGIGPYRRVRRFHSQSL